MCKCKAVNCEYSANGCDWIVVPKGNTCNANCDCGLQAVGVDGSYAPASAPEIAPPLLPPSPSPPSSQPAAPDAQPGGGPGGIAALWGQCGGAGFTGPTVCAEGVCARMDEWYHQCILGGGEGGGTPQPTTQQLDPPLPPSSSPPIQPSYTSSLPGSGPSRPSSVGRLPSTFSTKTLPAVVSSTAPPASEPPSSSTKRPDSTGKTPEKTQPAENHEDISPDVEWDCFEA